MKARHRIPTVFSIYMVDVLCCALGCVVLLWQLNYQEAEKQTAEANQALKQLQLASLSVESLTSDISRISADLESTQKRATQVTLQLDSTTAQRDKALALALVYRSDYERAKKAQAEVELAKLLTENVLADLQKEYKLLSSKNQTNILDRDAKARLAETLALKMKVAEKRIEDLETTLKTKDALALSAAAKMTNQDKLLDKASDQIKSLQFQLADMQSLGKTYLSQLDTSKDRYSLLQKDYDKSRKDLLDTSKQLRELVLARQLLDQRLDISSKELEQAKAIAATLKLDKIKLEGESRAIQLAAQNRFAGITLTGRRVVFLVDFSGSMKMSRADVEDPDKWPLICDTVGKIMSSLPNLTQYQVILFNGKTLYPLGNQGRWIDFSESHSIATTVNSLKAVSPVDETNMYDAFAQAFRYRDLGLDTIYLLSDGLPTSGEGLPTDVNQLNKLSQFERTEMLTRHIRQQLTGNWNRSIPNQQRVRINAIGFFFESPEVGAFLWALSRENDGSFVGMSRP